MTSYLFQDDTNGPFRKELVKAVYSKNKDETEAAAKNFESKADPNSVFPEDKQILESILIKKQEPASTQSGRMQFITNCDLNR